MVSQYYLDLRSENCESAYQVFTVEPHVGIHSLLANLSLVWKELCEEKTLTKEIFKSSLFERLRKAVNNAHFIVAGVNECESSSSTSHLLEEHGKTNTFVPKKYRNTWVEKTL